MKSKRVIFNDYITVRREVHGFNDLRQILDTYQSSPQAQLAERKHKFINRQAGFASRYPKLFHCTSQDALIKE